MDIKRIDQIIDKHGAEPSSLIQVLLELQSEYHWLPRTALADRGSKSPNATRRYAVRRLRT